MELHLHQNLARSARTVQWNIVDIHTVDIHTVDIVGRSEGELTASAGEELIIVEDDGSGWTLVARGSEEGYVPTTYLHKL